MKKGLILVPLHQSPPQIVKLLLKNLSISIIFAKQHSYPKNKGGQYARRLLN